MVNALNTIGFPWKVRHVKGWDLPEHAKDEAVGGAQVLSHFARMTTRSIARRLQHGSASTKR